ncbi:MAG: TrkH family potassium uptake protein [Clostridiaceae bacterium]|nr:TrkH family potassium uptake protein [Clostridiaceae bacterium]
MNYGLVRYIVGRIILITGLLMIPSLIVGLIKGDAVPDLFSLVWGILIAAALGGLLSFRRPRRPDFFMREGFVIVAISWLVLSALGALPFVISGHVPSFVDALFESASGFTTTGASVIVDVEALPYGLLFWRSFTHLIGGMGILVFALAVMPGLDSEGVHIMKAEVPGPTFGKLRAKVHSSARVLYLIYIAMTAILIVLLLLGGMNWFDAFIHGFGTAGTGGFSNYRLSVGQFMDSTYIQVVLSIGMLLFGINFNLYYFFLRGDFRSIRRNEELRWYLGIVAVAVILIVINLYPTSHNTGHLWRDAFFTVSSIITTTGYATVNFALWPPFSRYLLLLLMFIGGMAGSTAGGLKVGRVAIYFKSVIKEIRRGISPNRRLMVRFEGKALSHRTTARLAYYLMTFMFLFLLVLIPVTLSSETFLTAFSAVASTFSNVGPGLDSVGPHGNFAGFSAANKLLLTLTMIMGRLEIFPILVLLSPRTWRRT